MVRLVFTTHANTRCTMAHTWMETHFPLRLRRDRNKPALRLLSAKQASKLQTAGSKERLSVANPTTRLRTWMSSKQDPELCINWEMVTNTSSTSWDTTNSPLWEKIITPILPKEDIWRFTWTIYYKQCPSPPLTPSDDLTSLPENILSKSKLFMMEIAKAKSAVSRYVYPKSLVPSGSRVMTRIRR